MPNVPRGYTHDRDDSGLTARERQAYTAALDGLSLPQMGDRIGVSKSRAAALVRSLIKKGFLVRGDDGDLRATDQRPEEG